MANNKHLRTKIKSITNLQKTIKALEIVSTVKLQKLRRIIGSYKKFMEHFLEILQEIIKHINVFDFDEGTRNPEWKNLFIVVTSDKGLCGSINSKILKTLETISSDQKSKTDIFVVGKQGLEYFVRNHWNVVGSSTISDQIIDEEIKPISAFIKDIIPEKKYATIQIHFNFFRNSLVYIPAKFQLYPLDKKSFDEFLKTVGLSFSLLKNTDKKELIVEPNSQTFKFDFLHILIKNIITSALINNKTSEHAARMFAMKNAKDNSSEILTHLNLLYNKMRQAKITQEISEIVSAKIALE